jgi:hypothetical protein
MEATLGGKILAATVLDKDYRCDEERKAIVAECRKFCDYVTIYERKEIENFLLVPAAIDRAAVRRVADQAKRAGRDIRYTSDAAKMLDQFALQKRVMLRLSMYQSDEDSFVRHHPPEPTQQ